MFLGGVRREGVVVDVFVSRKKKGKFQYKKECHTLRKIKKHGLFKMLLTYNSTEDVLENLNSFLATSRALIDMESGELMLRVNDKYLILNVYKFMHSSSDIKSCIKMGMSDPPSSEPPDKSLYTPSLCKPPIVDTTIKKGRITSSKVGEAHKKKGKGEKGEQEHADKLSSSHQALEVQSPSLIWTDNKKKAVINDVSSRNFDPPRE
ncbi:hypothetical protein PIB30_020725 [Stylosanthes scabra]|uniref:Uncharacterized protein n=1 Tax=Stylosanthes scabra TaxID=79078 RepID=A0ABU6Y772_9FABA|nr:hypothetical protein [Stylosanthes scabra]